jgi:cysteine-rich repeat protein
MGTRALELAVLVWALAALPGCPADLGSCGDGHLDPGEACDDGNRVAGDGCSIDCRLVAPDLDGDGFSSPEDCNDRLASVYPGAPEIACDGLDNDCDPRTPDCPGGGDAGGGPGDAGAGPDASVDAAVPAPDACVPEVETCADCVDQDCDGADEPCDAAAGLTIDPPAPPPGSNVVIVVSSPADYVWVLLRHVSPDGQEEWLGCPDCVGSDGGRNTWTYSLGPLARGHHLVELGRDHVNDDPGVGTPVICRGFDVGP